MADEIDEKALLEKLLEQSGLFRPPGWIDPNATYEHLETPEEAEERLRQFRESMKPTPEEIAKVAEAEAAARANYDDFIARAVPDELLDMNRLCVQLNAADLGYFLARSGVSTESAENLLTGEELRLFKQAKREVQ